MLLIWQCFGFAADADADHAYDADDDHASNDADDHDNDVREAYPVATPPDIIFICSHAGLKRPICWGRMAVWDMLCYVMEDHPTS